MDADELMPAPTPFEIELSDRVIAAYEQGPGTVWTGTATVLAKELGLSRDEVGAISVTTDNVIHNRPLSAGLINNPRKVVLILVAEQVGISREAEAIRNLIPKTRHLRTVLLASRVDGVWRVSYALHVEGADEIDLAAPLFPCLDNGRIETVPLVPIGEESSMIPTSAADTSKAMATEVDSLEVAEESLSRERDIASVVSRVESAISDADLVLADGQSIARRCVLALYSGHLVLQGPPGTAKSTLARLLCKAFDVTHDVATATADWTTYDVVGGYRPTVDANGQEVLGAHAGYVTSAVRQCASTVAAHLDGTSPEQAHWLVIDELNRAEIDKAIGGLYSVLGNTDHRTLDLWFDTEDPQVVIPERFRIIATLNDVDSSFAYALSQGLSRRFTFVEIGVGGGFSEQELRSVVQVAVSWFVRNYDPDLDPATVEAELSASHEVLALARLVNEIRRPDGPGFPLGTAQVVDVVRRLVLARQLEGVAAQILDEAVADLFVAQLRNLPRHVLTSIDGWLADDSAQWPQTRRGVGRLLDPFSTRSLS